MNLKKGLKWCDAINVLRIQNERMNQRYFPSVREYSNLYGLDESKLDELNKHVPSPGNVDVSYVFDSSLSQASSLSMAIEDIKDECISIKDDNNLEDISNNIVLSKSQKKRLKQKRNKANQIIKNI